MSLRFDEPALFKALEGRLFESGRLVTPTYLKWYNNNILKVYERSFQEA
jgi:hypothetical protein